MAWEEHIRDGLSAVQQRDYAAAERALKRALQYAKDARDDGRLALALSLLGHLYFISRDFARAERLLEQSLRLNARPPANEPCLLMDFYALLQLKIGLAKPFEARALFDEMLPVAKQLGTAAAANAVLQLNSLELPPPAACAPSPDPLLPGADKGRADAGAGSEPPSGNSGSTSAADLWQHQLKRGLCVLDVDEEEKESWVAAYLNLESAFRLGRKLFEPGDPRLIANTTALADAAAHLRLQEVAQSLYREAIASARRHPRPDQVPVRLLRLSFAVVYAQFDQFKQAKKMIEEELPEGGGTDDLPEKLVRRLELLRGQIRIYESVQALLRQAQTAEDNKDFEQAARLSNTALSQLRQGFPPHHPEQARVLRYRARLLDSLGKSEQADELAKRAERIERSNDSILDEWTRLTQELPRPALDGVPV